MKKFIISIVVCFLISFFPLNAFGVSGHFQKSNVILRKQSTTCLSFLKQIQEKSESNVALTLKNLRNTFAPTIQQLNSSQLRKQESTFTAKNFIEQKKKNFRLKVKKVQSQVRSSFNEGGEGSKITDIIVSNSNLSRIPGSNPSSGDQYLTGSEKNLNKKPIQQIPTNSIFNLTDINAFVSIDLLEESLKTKLEIVQDRMNTFRQLVQGFYKLHAIESFQQNKNIWDFYVGEENLTRLITEDEFNLFLKNLSLNISENQSQLFITALTDFYREFCLEMGFFQLSASSSESVIFDSLEPKKFSVENFFQDSLNQVTGSPLIEGSQIFSQNLLETKKVSLEKDKQVLDLLKNNKPIADLEYAQVLLRQCVEAGLMPTMLLDDFSLIDKSQLWKNAFKVKVQIRVRNSIREIKDLEKFCIFLQEKKTITRSFSQKGIEMLKDVANEKSEFQRDIMGRILAIFSPGINSPIGAVQLVVNQEVLAYWENFLEDYPNILQNSDYSDLKTFIEDYKKACILNPL